MNQATPTSQRGSVIVFAVLVMASMLALSLALTGLLVGRLKASTAQRASVVAVYAADSAAEKCLYEARKQPASNFPTPTFTPYPGSTTLYAIASVSASGATVDITSGCKVLGINAFRFRATGKSGGVQRSLEINQ